MAVAIVEGIEREALSAPLKWAGGKRWLVPRLSELWSHSGQKRLVEPFAGGLAITLGLRPQHAVLNDLNPHLISFHKWLQRGLDLRPYKKNFENNQRAYLRNRRRFNKLIANGLHGESEAAALFYYLNRTGYNGLCRFNSSGFFNVPFGRYKNLTYRDDFFDYRNALRGFQITYGDFQLIEVRPADFVYADPPYDVEFTSYSAGGFSWDDQERLAEWLASHRGPVVASNQATPRICRLYTRHGFTVKKIRAPRRISCDGNRDDALEMFAYRNILP